MINSRDENNKIVPHNLNIKEQKRKLLKSINDFRKTMNLLPLKKLDKKTRTWAKKQMGATPAKQKWV